MFCAVLISGSFGTDIRESRTATRRMFPFLVWFCSLADGCSLTLQTRWHENAPKTEEINFRLSPVAQKPSVLKFTIADKKLSFSLRYHLIQ